VRRLLGAALLLVLALARGYEAAHAATCVSTVYVTVGTIQAAVNGIGPSFAGGDYCIYIDVTPTRQYTEQVLIEGINTDGNRIIIAADPAMGGAARTAVRAPGGGLGAAFTIRNASVTLRQIDVSDNGAGIPFGIHISSAYVTLSSVAVHSQLIYDSGVKIASTGWTTIAYSSSDMMGANAFYLAESSTVMMAHSTATNNSNTGGQFPLWLNGSSSGTFAWTMIRNLNVGASAKGVRIENSSRFNLIDRSTITSGGPSLEIIASSTNTVTQSIVGNGASINGSAYNTISYTTVTAQNVTYALHLSGDDNFVTRSSFTHPSGSGIYVVGSTNTISFSTVTNYDNTFAAVYLGGGYNTLSESFAGNSNGDAVSITGSFNSVQRSTATSLAAFAGYSGLKVWGGAIASSGNVISESYLESVNGYGARLYDSAVSNQVVGSTITSPSANPAFRIDSGTNTVSSSLVVSPNSAALFLGAGAHMTTIFGSTFAASAAAPALALAGASSCTVTRTLIRNFAAAGDGISLGAGSYNNLFDQVWRPQPTGSGVAMSFTSVSSNTVQNSVLRALGASAVLFTTSDRNTILRSTVANSAVGSAAVYVSASSDNLLSRCRLENISGTAVQMDGTSDSNSILLSSAAASDNMGAFILSGSSNTIGDSFVYNSNGPALRINAPGVGNVVSRSTLAAAAWGTLGGLVLVGSSGTVVADSYIQGSTGAYIWNHPNFTAAGSTFAATSGSGDGIGLGSGNVAFTVSSCTLRGGIESGSGVNLGFNNDGILSVSSSVFPFGARYGISGQGQSAGAQVWISSNAVELSSSTLGDTAGLRFAGLVTGATVHNNDVFLSRLTDTAFYIRGLEAVGSQYLLVRNNRISNPGRTNANPFYVAMDFQDSPNNDVLYNDIHSTGAASWCYGFRAGGLSSGIRVRGNIFSFNMTAAANYLYDVGVGASPGFASDYNHFFNPNGQSKFIFNGPVYNSLDLWRDGTAFDRHSYQGDPLWKDVGTGDFHLRSSFGRYDPALGWVNDAIDSPAVDRGAPTDSYTAEPYPNGLLPNAGSYGGTYEASYSVPETVVGPEDGTYVSTRTPALLVSGQPPYRYQYSIDAAFSGIFFDTVTDSERFSAPMSLASLTTYWWRISGMSGRSFVVDVDSPAMFAAQLGTDPVNGTWKSYSTDTYMPTTTVSLRVEIRDLEAGLRVTTGYPTGLVGLWHLDESSGPYAYDSSTNGFHAQLMPGLARVPGRFGNASSFWPMPFPGVPMYVPPRPQLDLHADFTLEAWAQSFYGLNDMAVLSNYVVGGSQGFRFGINPTGYPSGSLYYSDAGGLNVLTAAELGTPLNDGSWHHLAAVRKNTNVHVYVDGTYRGTFTGSNVLSAGSGLGIGSSPETFQKFYGSLDEVRVFSLARSSTEIQQDFLSSPYNALEGTAPYRVMYSTNGGETWVRASTAQVTLSGIDADRTMQYLTVSSMTLTSSSGPSSAANLVSFFAADYAGNVATRTYTVMVDTTSVPPPGCGETRNVRLDGFNAYTSISGALATLPAVLSTSACIVIRDEGPYIEHVDVRGFTNSQLIRFIGLTAAGKGRPVLQPNDTPTDYAGFEIANSSVSLENLHIILRAFPQQYAVLASSAYVHVSSVTIEDPESRVGTASLQLSSWSTLSYSSVSAQNAAALALRGSSGTAVYASTAQAYGAGYALYVYGAQNNDFDLLFASNSAGNGALFIVGSDLNRVRRSTFAASDGGSGLFVSNGSSNTFQESVFIGGHGTGVSGPGGSGLVFSGGGYSSLDRIQAAGGDGADGANTGSGGKGLYLMGSSSNTIERSVLRGGPGGSQPGGFGGGFGGSALRAETSSRGTRVLRSALVGGAGGDSGGTGGGYGADAGDIGDTSDGFEFIGSSATGGAGGNNTNAPGNGAGNAGHGVRLTMISTATVLGGVLTGGVGGPGTAGCGGNGGNGGAGGTGLYAMNGSSLTVLVSTMTGGTGGSGGCTPGVGGKGAQLGSNTASLVARSILVGAAGGTSGFNTGGSGGDGLYTLANTTLAFTANTVYSGTGGSGFPGPGAQARAVVLQGNNGTTDVGGNRIIGLPQAEGLYVGAGNTGVLQLTSNTVSGARFGIEVTTQIAGPFVFIASNTVLVNADNARDTIGILLDGLATGATVQNNAVVLRQGGDLGAFSAMGIMAKTAAKLVIDHNRVSNPGLLTGGSYAALWLSDADDVLAAYNDFHSTGTGLLQACLVGAEAGSTGLLLRNNVFSSSWTVTMSSATLFVDAASQSGFQSDYNDFFSSNSLTTFEWGGGATTDLAGWKGLTGMDAHSISAHPLWADPGAGVEDFHPRSQASNGRFNPATGVFDRTDALASPLIDAGDPVDGVLVDLGLGLEPASNGLRANLGSYGRTAQASKTYCPTWAVPAGCSAAQTKNVVQNGCGDAVGINAGLGLLPTSFSGGDACVVLRDAGKYSETMWLRDITNNDYFLRIFGDPSFTSSAPVVSPLPLSTAAFIVQNASVSISGLQILPTSAMPYGILASSSQLVLSSVSVLDAGGLVYTAGIRVSSWTSLSHSSIAVQDTHGVYVTGVGSTVSYSTVTNLSAGSYALYLHSAVSNVVVRSSLTNMGGGAVSLDNPATYNRIDETSMRGNLFGTDALRLVGASYNSFTGDFLYNPLGDGVTLSGFGNTLAQSTVTAGGGGNSRCVEIVNGSDYTFVTQSYISATGGGYALWLYNASHSTISFSTLTAAGGQPALSIDGPSPKARFNLITDDFIYNTGAPAVHFSTGAEDNLLTQSTLTIVGAGTAALWINGASSNTVSRSYISNTIGRGVVVQASSASIDASAIRGSTAVFVLASSGTVVTGSTLTALTNAGSALHMLGGGSGLYLGTNTFTGGAQGAGVFIGEGGGGLLSLFGNVVTSAAEMGVYVATPAAGASVFISSNVVYPRIVNGEKTCGLCLHGASGAVVWGNDVLLRASGTSGASGETEGIFAQAAANLLIAHNRVSNPGMMLADGTFAALFLSQSPGGVIEYNDFYSTGTLLSSAALLVVSETSPNVEVRHNIFYGELSEFAPPSGSTWTLVVSVDSMPGFRSNHNLFYSANGVNNAEWNGAHVALPGAWQAVSGQDLDSILADPLWADPGYDFHPKSLNGRYNPATTGFDFLDAQQSPSIDAGAPGADHSAETGANGGFVNLGSYGNTAEASRSYPGTAVAPADGAWVSTNTPVFLSYGAGLRRYRLSEDAGFVGVHEDSKTFGGFHVTTVTLPFATTVWWQASASPAFTVVVDTAAPLLSLPQVSTDAGSGVWSGVASGVYMSSTVVSLRVTAQDPDAGLFTSTGLPQGLRGQWHFDEDSGQDALDASTGTRTARLNSASRVDGRRGRALSFSGVDGSYASVPDSAFMPQGASPRTVSAWVRSNGALPGTRMAYFGYGGVGTGLAFNVESGVLGGGRLYFVGYNTADLAGNAVIADGSWHHVAAVYDGAELRLYVDGVLDVSAAKALNTSDVGTYPLTVGRQSYPDGTYWPLDGSVDELRVYGTALSTAEVLAQYQSDTLAAHARGKAYSVAYSTDAGATWRPVEASSVALSGSNTDRTPQTLLVSSVPFVTTTAPGVRTNLLAVSVADYAGNVSTAAYEVLVDTSVPSAPPVFAAAGVGTGTAAGVWSFLTNSTHPVLGYRLELSTVSDFSGTIQSSYTAANYAAFANLSANTTFHMRAIAWNLVGEGPYTVTIATATGARAPASAASTFSALGTTFLTAQWSADGNPGGTRYDAVLATSAVFWTLDAANVWVTTRPEGAPQADYTGLDANTTYFLYVQAIGHNGSSTPFTALGATVTLVNDPVVAVGDAFSGRSTASVVGYWGANGNSAGTRYRAVLSTAASYSEGAAWNVVTTTDCYGTPAAPFNGLFADTTWYLYVSALNRAGTPTPYLAAGTTVTFSTAPTGVVPPFSLVGASSMTASWSANGSGPGTRYDAVLSSSALFTVTDAGNVSVSTRPEGAPSAEFTPLSPNTTWYLHVRTFARDGSTTAYQSLGSTSTLAADPSAPAYGEAQATALTFVWNVNGNLLGKTSYYLQCSTAPDFTGQDFTPNQTDISTLPTGGAAATLSGLSSNTTYYARLRAFNHGGIPSADLLFPATATLAQLPASFAPDFPVLGSSSSTIHWGTNGNPIARTTYTVTLSTAPDFSAPSAPYQVRFDTVPAYWDQTASFSGLVPNTTYYFSVTALNHNGLRSPTLSGPSTSTLAADPVLGAQTFTGISTDTLGLLWSANGNPLAVTTYTVTLSTAADFSAGGLPYQLGFDTVPTAGPAASAGGLAANTTYHLRVRARDHGGVPTDEVFLGSVATLAYPPQPFAPTFLGVGLDSVTVTWSANGNPQAFTTYTVVMTSSPVFPNAFDNRVLSTAPLYAFPAATLGALQANTTYYLWGTALNRAGLASGYVALGSTTTLAADPATAVSTFSAVQKTSLSGHWSANGNGAGTLYEAVVSQSAAYSAVDPTNVPVSTRPEGAPSADFSPLSPNTTYYLHVRAVSHNAVPTAFVTLGATVTLVNDPVVAVGDAFSDRSTSSVVGYWGDGGNGAGTRYRAVLSTAASYSEGAAWNVVVTTDSYGAPAAPFDGLLADTTWYLYVSALNRAGTPTAYIAAGTTVTFSTAPTGMVPAFSLIGASSMTASWSANGNGPGTRYEAVLSTSAPFSATDPKNVFRSTAPQSPPSDIFAGLDPNTTYYLYVRTLARDGTPTAYQALGSTWTLAADPTAASWSAVESDALTASWSANGNLLGQTTYQLQASTAADFSSGSGAPYQLDLDTVPLAGPAASFSGLFVNTTYYLRLRAINHGGVASAILVFTSTATLARTPGLLPPTFKDLGSSSTTVRWSANGNPLAATTFTVVLSTAPDYSAGGAPYQLSLDTVPVWPGASFAGLVPNTTYFVSLTAVNFNGVRTASLAGGSTSTLAADPALGAQTFTGVSTDTLNLLWSANGNPLAVTTYTVTLSTAADFSAGGLPYQLGFDTVPTAGPAASAGDLAANTTYHLRVRARDHGGVPTDEVFLGSAATLAYPPQPFAPTFLAVALDSVTVTWSANGNPQAFTTYTVVMTSSPVFPNAFDNRVLSTAPLYAFPSASFSGLQANTTYYLWGTALNRAGVSSGYVPLGSTTTLAADPATAVSTFSAVQKTSLSGHWSANGNGAGTLYEAVVSQSAAYSAVDPTNVPVSTRPEGAPSAGFSPLSPNTTYYLHVRAFSHSGVPTGFVTLGDTVTLVNDPAAAVGDAFSDRSTSSVVGIWGDGGNVAGTRYRAVLSTAASYSEGAAWNVVVTTDSYGAPAAPFDGLLADTTWYLYVSALNRAGTPTAYIAAGTTVTFSTAPTGMVPAFSLIGASSMTASWSANGNGPGTRYDAVLSTSALFTASDGGNVLVSTRPQGAPSAVFTPLSPNTTYYLHARTFGRDGAATAYQALGSTSSQAAEPTGASYAGLATTGLSVLWSPNGNLLASTTYELQASTAPDFSATAAPELVTLSTAPAAGPAASFSGLLVNTTYYVRLRALNHGGVPSNNLVVTGTSTLADQPAGAGFPEVWKSSMTVEWTAGGDPVGTRFLLALSTENAWPNAFALTRTLSTAPVSVPAHATPGGLVPNTTYYLFMTAYNHNGVPSAFAALGSTLTYAELPLFPAGCSSCAAPGVSSMTVGWASGGNPAGTEYLVQVSSDSGFSAGFELPDSGWSVALTTGFVQLSTNSLYYVRAKARNASLHETPFTTLGSTWTLAAAPGTAVSTYSAVGISSVTLQWTSGGNPPGTEFIAQASTDATFGGIWSASGWGPAVSTDVAGLGGNTTFYFRVLARNGAGVLSAPLLVGSTVTRVSPPSGGAFEEVGAFSLRAGWDDSGNGGGEVFGAWSAGTPLPASRSGLALVHSGGRLYAAGGSDGTPRSTVWYAVLAPDGTVGAWTAASSLPAAREGLALAVSGGKLFAFGGTDGTVRANVYQAPILADGSLGAWSETTPLPAARYRHAAAAYGGRVFVSGGDNGIAAQSTVWYADARGDGSLGLWQSAAALPAARSGHGMAVSSAALFVAGGTGAGVEDTLWRGDLSAGAPAAWSVRTPLPAPRTRAAFAATSGRLYLLGGHDGASPRAEVYSAAVSTDGTVGAWRDAGPLSGARYMAAAALAGERVYAAGGDAGGGALSTVLVSSFTGTLYQLERAQDAGFTVDYGSTGYRPGVAREFTGLTPDRIYYLQVRALSADGTPTSVLPLGSTRTYSAPPALTTPAFTDVQLGSVTVAWAAGGNPGGVAYRVQRASSADFGGTLTSSAWAAAFSYAFDPLAPNAPNSFRVQSRDGLGREGAFRFIGSTWTLAAAPSGSTFTAVAADGFSFEWSGGANPVPTRYEVQVATLTAFANVVGTSVTYSTSAAFAGLASATTFYVRVRAFNGDLLPTAFDAAVSTLTRSDALTPAAATGLAVAPAGNADAVLVTWTAPGDDGTTGTLLAGSRFYVQWTTGSPSAVTWSTGNAQASVSTGPVVPGASSSAYLGGLPSASKAWVRVWTQDAAGNLSPASALATGFVSPFAFSGLDAPVGGAGGAVSLAADRFGILHEAHIGGAARELRYFARNGGLWAAVESPDPGVAAAAPSLAVHNDGRPALLYRDAGSGKLKRATKSGVWSAATVEDGNLVAGGIAVDAADREHISYYDAAAGDLKYGLWDGTAWSTSAVASAGDVGRASALALDRLMLPHILYYDASNGDLRHAWWTGAAWSDELVDGTGVDVGSTTALAVDGEGVLHAVYGDSTSGALRYSSRTASGWNPAALVDQGGPQARVGGLVLDGTGKPVAVYGDRDPAVLDLKLARWTGTSWSTMTVDGFGEQGAESALALDAAGAVTLVYADGASAQVRSALWSAGLSAPIGGARSMVQAPYAMSGTAVSSTTLQWSWTDGSNDELGFALYGAAAATGPYTVVAGTASIAASPGVGAVKTYLETGLSANATYYRYALAVAPGGFAPAGVAGAYPYAAVDHSSPTISVHLSGDGVWRRANNGTYDVDFADLGGSGLARFQAKASTTAAGAGTDLLGWTDVVVAIGSDTYAADWGLPAAVFTAMLEGTTNYVALRVEDGLGNATTLLDAFYVLKDTTTPVVSDNQSGDTALRSAGGTVYDVDAADSGGGLAHFQYSVSLAPAAGDAALVAWTDVTGSAGLKSFTADWPVDFAALASGTTNYVSVRAIDAAGSTTTVVDAFYVLKDTAGPSVRITAPASAYLSALTTVSGTASAPLSGVKGVEVSIQNNPPGGSYWNGAGFLAGGPVWFVASGTTSWSYAPGLTLVNGQSYQVVARASSTLDNYSTPYSTAAFVFDASTPTLVVQAPVSGSTVNSLPVISGTAADPAPTDSGISSVEVRLRRNTDNLWWNFATETWSALPVSSVPAGSTAWSLTPSDLLQASLAHGTSYYVSARASDNASPPNAGDFYLQGATFTFSDPAPPAAITDLSALEGTGPGELRLTWTAPGDDGSVRTILLGQYRIHYSTDAAAAFSTSAAQVAFSTSAVQPGSWQGRTIGSLSPGVTYYLRAFIADSAGQWSALSNGATAYAGMQSTTTLTGHVVKVSSEGITAVLVEAFDAAGTLQATTFTLADGSGTYALSGLGLGTYRVQATWTAGDVTSAVWQDGIGVGSVNVDFVLQINYTLATLTGSLQSVGAAAPAGFGTRAAAGAFADSRVELYARGRQALSVPVSPSGRWTISNLLPGRYGVRAYNGLEYTDVMDVEVGEGETKEVGFLFDPLPEGAVFAFPNPARSATTVRFTSGLSPLEAQVAIFDIAGNLVREIAGTEMASPSPGLYHADWDLRNGRGEDVASGVYLFMVKVRGGAGGQQAKVIKKLAVVR
jgi:hypothetical protein